MKIFNLEIRKVQKEAPLQDVARVAGTNLFQPMNYKQQLQNTTTSACVFLISDAIASLSCNVYKRSSGGRERDDRPSLAYCLRKAPNYYDIPFTFKQTIGMHLTLKGNAFIFITRNSDYSVKSLTPLDPDLTVIKFDDKNEIYYEYHHPNGNVYKYSTENILHIPAYRYNTIRGMSPMEYAYHCVKLGLNLDEFTNDSFDGGIRSKLLIEVPAGEKKFTEEDAQKLKERIKSAYGGREHWNDPFVVGNGTKATPLNLSSNADSQLTENRIFSEAEVAKIYRVPLFMLGKQDSKFTNQEQANTFFLQHTLTPWLIRIQQSLDKLLTYPFRDDHYVEFDTDTILRADYKSRLEMEIKGLQGGIYTPNQVYDLENLPRTKEEWGNKHFFPVNLSTMDKISQQPLQDAKQKTLEKTATE